MAYVVIRGVSRKPSYVHFSGKRYDVDFTDTCDNINQNVIAPLLSCGLFAHVKVVCVTYSLDEQSETELRARLNADLVIYMPGKIEDHSQSDVFLKSLELALEDGKEEEDFLLNACPDELGPDPVSLSGQSVVIITRFDVMFKGPITRLDIDVDAVNFLWLETGSADLPQISADETEEVPDASTTKHAIERAEAIYRVAVSDVLHVAPIKYVPSLINTVKNNVRKGIKKNMHNCYCGLVEEMVPVNFVIKNRKIDSNSDSQWNPVYVIFRGKSRKGLLPSHTGVFWARMLGKKIL
jgi:hypothetical protein